MEKSKNNKKTISSAIGVGFGLLVAFLVKQFVFAPPSFDKQMVQAAQEINKSCPIMVDEETRLDSASVFSDNTLQYNYTLINWTKDSIDLESFESYMQPVILNNVKTSSDMKIYRDNKTSIAYSYNDMNGEFVSKILITADQYLMEE